MEKLSDAVRNILADAIGDLYDGGELKIYSGSQPATPITAPTGTLLATITLPTPAFSAAVAGVKSKTGVWTTTGLADDDAGWGRMKTSGGADPIDFSIGASGSGEDIEMDSVAIETGQTVTVSAFTFTQPAA